MPLEPPNLDDRTFEEIKNELLLRIPRYTPEWTDWNPSDPGATLIELFAWLTESIGYRLNKAPERCLLTFLEVLGITPLPARAAVTDLTFTVREGETRPIPVPARTAVASDVQTEDGPIVFETERGLDLIPLRLQSLQVAGLTDFDLYTIDDDPPPQFRPFGPHPQPGNAFYLGFGPADTPVTFPQQLAFLVDPLQRQQTLPTDARFEWSYRAIATTDRWTPLSTHDDGTRAFTRRGYVRIAGPRDSVAVAGLGKEARPLHWLRCQLVSGRYATGQEPVIDLFRYNTVEATSLTSVADEVAGQSDGRTGQVVRLRFRPVLPGSLSVSIVPPPGQVAQDDEPWKVVPDLVTSGPTDRHLVVNGSRGELRFGDGRNGQVPLAGLDIMVSYRYGGASLANVARDSIKGLQTAAPGVDSVTNLRPAETGADEESPAALLRHAPSRLRSLERAVTAEDYRQLALRVGGVADAVALERWNPDYPGIDIPGCVTVVILPDSADPRPYASPELLDAVREVLAPARTIGSELFVRSARFVEVTVKVIVDVDPYAAFEEIRAEVASRLDDELAPKSADGGSRFGRDFFPTTLFGVVKSVLGVIAVRLLEVTVQGDTQTTAHPPVSDPVVLRADQLIVPGSSHDIRVQPRRDL